MRKEYGNPDSHPFSFKMAATITAEEPLNSRCSSAGSTTKVILAVKKIVFFFYIMNKSNKIRIRFSKYWILINLCKLKSNFVFFKKKKISKTGHRPDNFYDINKPDRILLDNLIAKKCTKFQVDWMKIVWLMLSADLKNTVLRETRHSRHFEKRMWIEIPILLFHRFHKFLLLRKYVTWFWLSHRGSFVDTSNF